MKRRNFRQNKLLRRHRALQRMKHQRKALKKRIHDLEDEAKQKALDKLERLEQDIQNTASNLTELPFGIREFAQDDGE